LNRTGIDNNDRIESFFDNVSYQKGGAVLRMLRAWLTRRDERAAVQPRLRYECHYIYFPDGFATVLQRSGCPAPSKICR
jgi:hypothetical protein